jgi:hypothetical protein
LFALWTDFSATASAGEFEPEAVPRIATDPIANSLREIGPRPSLILSSPDFFFSSVILKLPIDLILSISLHFSAGRFEKKY